jgi:hypothetical protein
MKLPRLAGHAIAPLHLVAGFLFALLPASPYDNGTYAVYGAILVVLATAVLVAAVQRPGAGALALQLGAAALAVALPFFRVDFSDLWHANVYQPIMAGSVIVCLLAALVGRTFGQG